MPSFTINNFLTPDRKDTTFQVQAHNLCQLDPENDFSTHLLFCSHFFLPYWSLVSSISLMRLKIVLLHLILQKIKAIVLRIIIIKKNTLLAWIFNKNLVFCCTWSFWILEVYLGCDRLLHSIVHLYLLSLLTEWAPSTYLPIKFSCSLKGFLQMCFPKKPFLFSERCSFLSLICIHCNL